MIAVEGRPTIKDVEARAALRRLLRVLYEIEFAAEAPPAGGSVILTSGRGGSRETTLQEAERVAGGGRPTPPDPSRERYRKLLRRVLVRIDRLAERAHNDLVGATPSEHVRDGSWRCGACGTWRSDRETYCASCGTRHGDKP